METISTYETNIGRIDDASSAADRALDILEFLEVREEPQTLTQIVDGLMLPKASVHRLLGTLRARGYIEQSRPRGGYSLGLRVLRLAARARERIDIVRISQPALRQLAGVTGESCQISVRSGLQALCVVRVASPAHPDFSLAGDVGSVFPLHAAAVGKVLLAYAPPAERGAYLARQLTAYTPETHASPTSLEQELDDIRRVGLAYDRQEYKRGLSALAAPLFDHDGAVNAAIALPFFALAAGNDTPSIDAKAEALREAAASISRALGAPPTTIARFHTATLDNHKGNHQ